MSLCVSNINEVLMFSLQLFLLKGCFESTILIQNALTGFFKVKQKRALSGRSGCCFPPRRCGRFCVVPAVVFCWFEPAPGVAPHIVVPFIVSGMFGLPPPVAKKNSKNRKQYNNTRLSIQQRYPVCQGHGFDSHQKLWCIISPHRVIFVDHSSYENRNVIKNFNY